MLNLIQRQVLQVARLAQGVRNGSLTAPELVQGAQTLRNVHTTIRADRQEGLSPREFVKDQLWLDASSARIYGLKHNERLR
jgi:hypothetical protein